MSGDPAATDDVRVSFDAELAGRRATCEGGAQAGPASRVGGRDTFVGTLSGRRLDYGDPPWRWVELTDLTERPEGFAEQQLWCEESFIFLHDEEEQARRLAAD